MPESVAIVGAGLVGSLAAIGFSKRGYDVVLFDFRSDPRTTPEKNLRSINLAVSDRGISAMDLVDPEMSKRILEDIIPMKGRMIHDSSGHQESQIYGLFGEHINSIDRAKLNEDLIIEIENLNKVSKSQITLKFNCKIDNLKFDEDIDKAVLICKDETYKFDFVIGADGSYSNIRYQLQKYIRMNYTQEYIDKCYLELYIPPGPKSSFLIDPNHLHIWPRKDFMLIALANTDGSFTSTFFGPWKLTESLNKPGIIESFFKTNFPDAVGLIGLKQIISVFMESPKGALMQVTCNKYHFSNKCIIVGDAAHSMVPFYGQGMNCGFEDIRILLQLMDKCETRGEAFEIYTSSRLEDLNAIQKLALDNYKEMSTKVISSLYLFRKKLDGILGKLIPQYWVPLYTMVSFRADIPYSQCIKREKRQLIILKGVEFTLISAGLFCAFAQFYKRK